MYSRRASAVCRRAIYGLLILTTVLGAGVTPQDQAQARCRLFRRRCCQPVQACSRPPSAPAPGGSTAYCPVYGGQPAGDLWLYYGMKHISGTTCMGPPRPLYYENELNMTGCVYTANCVDTGILTAQAFRADPTGAAPAASPSAKACKKGFNKNKPVPADVSATPDQYKRTFKDQNGVKHKLHLFKVDLTFEGVTYPDIGHGYGPRAGDADPYPDVVGVVFNKDPNSFCGVVDWADAAGGPVVTYHVILNKN
jgi:hypothetical protein